MKSNRCAAAVAALGAKAAPAAAQRLAVVRAFRRHNEVLVAHLADEEQAVVPLPLRLKPAEFERYSRS